MKVMNRNEARMIAEELYKLVRKDIKQVASGLVIDQEEYIDSKEAAKFLGVSLSFLKKNILDIPHVKVGRLNKFKKSLLIEYINR